MSLNKIMSTITETMSGDFPRDVRRNIYALVQSVFEKLDLVTREELKVQEKVLLRTREKFEALEARITELEENRNSHSD